MDLEKWVKLKVSNKSYQLNIIEGRLSENGIQSVIINKIDSSYLNFGEAELNVKESDFERAKEILKDDEK
ncbi:MAG: DUF2007 domain-containing protein [Bacteroidia bacterium]|nr:DUF2007 domain-containing protein [Bacteroidia bacterium]|tara:strand:- start:206 stop:415 length:210 start_codon:yes stop_codon:yes gene_type:complete